jgi:hypothetical protein
MITDSAWKIIGQNKEHFSKFGVEQFKWSTNVIPEAYMDIPFLRQDGKTVVPVPLFHVRTPFREEVLLGERIENNVQAPGFIVRRPGESKIEAYNRAQKVAKYYSNEFKKEGFSNQEAVSTNRHFKISFRKKQAFFSNSGRIQIFIFEDNFTRRIARMGRYPQHSQPCNTCRYHFIKGGNRKCFRDRTVSVGMDLTSAKKSAE